MFFSIGRPEQTGVGRVTNFANHKNEDIAVVGKRTFYNDSERNLNNDGPPDPPDAGPLFSGFNNKSIG